MFKKRFFIKSLGALFSIVLPTSIIVSCSNSFDDKESDNKSYVFQGKSFKSMSSIANYVQEHYISSQEVKKSISPKPKWTIDGVQKVFSKLSDLDDYIQNQNIEAQTANIRLSNEDDLKKYAKYSSIDYADFFNSIPSNMVIPLPKNASNDLGKAYIFKGYNDKIFFTTNKEDILNAEESAKKSWVQMHSAYLFRGVYFQNLQDLKFYLNNKFLAQASNENGLNELKRYQISLPIYAGKSYENNYQHWLIPAKYSNKQWKVDSSGKQKLKSIIKNHIRNNSITKLQGTDSELYSTDEFKDVSLLNEHINFWNLGSQNGKNTYLVDSKDGSRGNLIGNYMVSSSTDIGQKDRTTSEGIMNYKKWDQLGSDEKAIKSLLVNEEREDSNSLDILISSAFNTIKFEKNFPTMENNHESKVSFTDLLNYLFKYEKSNFNFSKADDFYSYLNSLEFSSEMPIYRNLGTEIQILEKKLLSGKKYNSFYLLPIIRSFLLSRLFIDGVRQYDLSKINDVFVKLADTISKIVNKKILNDLDLNDHNSQQEPQLLLNKIYGFNNRAESLYDSPSKNIKNVFNDSLIAKRLKAKVYSQIAIFSALTNNIAIIAQKINDFSKGKSNSMEDALLPSLDSAFQSVINKDWPADLTYVAKLKIKIKSLISKIKKDNYSWISLINQYNKKIKNYYSNNNNINSYNYNYDYNQSTYYNNYSNNTTDKRDEIQNSGKVIFAFISQISLDINAYRKNQHSEITQVTISSYLALDLVKSSALSKVNDLVSPWIKDLKHSENSSILDSLSKNMSKIKGFSKIGSKIEGVVSKIKSVIKFVNWVNYAFIAFNIIMDIIDWFTPKYSQVFHIYDKPIDGSKYAWDGGESLTQYGSTSITHSIEELELVNPIQVTVSHNSSNSSSNKVGSASNFYFNGKFYNSPSEIVVDVFKLLRTIKDPEALSKFVRMAFDSSISVTNSYVFDNSNENAAKVSEKKWKNDKELSLIADDVLSGPNGILKSDSSLNISLPSKYLDVKWKSDDGLTSSKASAIKKYVENILSNLKPVTIFVYPKDENNTLVPSDYHIPYPYFSFSSNSFEKLNTIDEQQKNRVIFDPNIEDKSKKQASLSNFQAINDYLNTNVLPQFNVPSKHVSMEAVLNVSKFSKISEIVLRRKVYKAISPLGQVNYYWSLSAAISWLKNAENYNAKINVSEIFEKLYSYSGPQGDKTKKFLTIEDILKWLISKKIIKEVNNA